VKAITLLSTGSIGTQTLDIVASTDQFRIVGLAAGRNVEMLSADPAVSTSDQRLAKKKNYQN